MEWEKINESKIQNFARFKREAKNCSQFELTIKKLDLLKSKDKSNVFTTSTIIKCFLFQR